MSSYKNKKSKLEQLDFEEVEDLLRYKEDDPPVEHAGDLRRRRDINAAIDMANGNDASTGTGNRPWARLRYGSVAGLIAIAAATIVTSFSLGLFEKENVEQSIDSISSAKSINSDQGKVPSSVNLPVNCLLASNGEQKLVDSIVSGKGIATGSHIVAQGEPVVLGVADRTKIHLSTGAEVALVRSDTESLELLLHRGDVLVSVDPGAKGPVVAVRTSKGLVKVKGTVFSLQDTGDDVLLEVYRGEVQVNTQSMSSGTVRGGRGYSLAQGLDWAVSQEREQDALDLARRIDVLDSSENAALEIKSSPSHANVILDGTFVGFTPVVLLTRAGYRELELQLAGHAPIRETIGISRDNLLARYFEMVSEKNPEPFSGKETQASATAGQLLRDAQALRKNRNWAGAARAYSRLLTTYPSSAEALNGRVSLGLIQLKQLASARKALSNFNSYLKAADSGALAEEALWGKSTALRTLGNKSKEKYALEIFISRFPNSLRIDEAQRRLAQIGKN